MAAKRCSVCNIRFPNIPPFTAGICPVDPEHKLWHVPDVEPDEDWRERVVELRDVGPAEPHDPTELAELIPKVDAPITFKDGRPRVVAWDVWPAVHRRMEATELIRIGDQVFEILGYVFQTREYILRPFSTELSEEDLRRLAGD